ncbi:DUF732 domain-containing protein [Arachnia propionica]|uniref:DUF732 domain-containing protein n=1 Tax=Arachnia propionica TaxID=1750 RepID=UPI001639D59D|nr:DUF732 domain-containing protein [Arachnia propionica]
MTRLLAPVAVLALISLAACSGPSPAPGASESSSMVETTQEVTTENLQSEPPAPDETATMPAPDLEGDPVPAFIGMVEMAGVERGSATDEQLTVAGHHVCAAFKEGRSLKEVVAGRADTDLAAMDEKSYQLLAVAASEVLCMDEQARIAEEYQQLS